MRPNRTIPTRSRHFVAGAVALLAGSAAGPATAQVSETEFAEAAAIVRGYADDMMRAMPCIYVVGVAYSRTGEDRFDEAWGETAVVEALEDFDAFSDEQRAALLAVFAETYAPDYAVADVRELAHSCHASEDEEQSIAMQLRLFTGVSIPLDARLDRALD